MTHLVITDADGRFALADLKGNAVTISANTVDGALGALAELAAGVPARPLELRMARLPEPARRPSSAAWLALLPDGPDRRRFVLDCTGCHQFDETRAWKDGAPRTLAQWREDVGRMLGFAGPGSSFPVISTWAEGPVAEWLVTSLGERQPAAGFAGAELATDAVVTEFDFPEGRDLPHDLAIESSGRVIITGMFSHAMYRLDPTTGRHERIEIPIPRANPRAVELDRDGNWWVLLGGPGKVARYRPDAGDWTFYDIGMYPHSVAVGSGSVWFNGHFTRDPELIGRVDIQTGQVETYDLPPHSTLRLQPGGPIPYEQRLAPDGRIWVSELQGNRLVVFDPSTRESMAYDLPPSWGGPRRFDVGPDGVLWIPAYSANLLIRFDPASGRFAQIPLPLDGATPYIARVDARTGDIWIGTSAADAVFRYEPGTGTFATYALPSQGALVRHLAIDSATGDVWVAYGASPARVPARIARIRRGR